MGTSYYGKDRITTTTVSVVEDGKKIYKKKVVTEHRPKEEWIGVPVPDSGIPPETVALARENLKGNIKSVSKNDGRVWELSGGVTVCSECGRRIGAHTTLNSRNKRYHYYRCSNREGVACSNRKHRPARELEMRVKDAFRPETWESFVDDLCDCRLQDLHVLHRSDPDKAKENLTGRIKALETKIDRVRDLFIDGDLPLPDYEAKKASIQEEIEVLRQEFSKVDDLDEIRRVEDLRKVLKGVHDPFSGHYTLTEGPEQWDGLIDEDLSYGSKETAAKRRQEFYRRVGMRVKVGEELEIILGVDKITVCNRDTVPEAVTVLLTRSSFGPGRRSKYTLTI